MLQNLPVESPEVDFDTPVGEESLPVDRIPSFEEANITALQAAVLLEEQTDMPLFEAFQSIRQSGLDPKKPLQALTRSRAESEKGGLVEAFQQAPGETPEDVALGIEAIQELLRGLDKDAGDEDLAFVRAASQGQLDPDTERRLAFQLRVAKMMQEIWDDMSWGDVALSGIGLIVPGNILKSNKKMTGSYLQAQEWMQNFVLHFKSLPIEEQEALLPTVKDFLFEGLGNEFKVMGVLSAILEPGGEEDLQDFNKWWALFDVADISLVTGALALRVAKLKRQLNAAKLLNETLDTARAADVVAGSLVDDTIRGHANLDPEAAYGIAAGMNTGLDPAYTAGLAGPVAARIQSFHEAAAKSAELIAGEKLILKEGLMQKQERANREALEVTRLSEQGVENIRITDRTSNTTVFQYEEVVPVLGGDDTLMPSTILPTTERVTRTRALQLQLDDIGNYEQSSVSILSSWLGSKNVIAKGNLLEEVQSAIRMDTAQAKVYTQLVELHREALKSVLGPGGLKGLNPASRKKLAELDHVLRYGDEVQRTFTPLELRAGVDGVKLNDSQIEAYFKTRSLVDSLFWLRNAEERKAKTIKGMKEVRLDENTKSLARPLESPEAASQALRASRPDIVWDIERQYFRPIAELGARDLDEAYSVGRVLVRFDQPQLIPGTPEKVTYALVGRGDIHEMPQQILHYRPGYIPKINLDALYFAKVFEKTRIDGKDIPAGAPGAITRTVRMFDNKKDADAWVAKYQEENPGVVIRAVEDRQLELERRGSIVDGPSSGGFGLYTGPRSSEMIPFGLEGKEPERLGAFEAISRNISNVSRYVTKNEWRMGVEKRILNTANHLIPGGNYRSYAELERVSDQTQAGKFIHQMRGMLDEWMGVPAKEEQLFEAAMQTVYEGLVGSKLPGIEHVRGSVGYLRHKDPIRAARAATFNMLLGTMSVAQVFVQASGASVAASMNIMRPAELARVFAQKDILGLLDNMPAAQRATEHVAKAFGMPAEEVQAFYAGWRKTGLLEGVLTTADHGALMAGRGVTVDMLARAAEVGRIPYNIGELFNRRFSFTTAWREFQQKHGRLATSDADLKEVLTRTNNLTLSLHKANQAYWQKGALGLATMFLQIATKTAESLLGVNGSFTRAERAKLFFAQALLWGAAGVPLGGMAVNMFAGMSGMKQEDIENMHPEAVKAINEGFIGWLTMAMFDVDIDVAPRMSLIRSIHDYTDKFLFEDQNIATFFMGAFGSVADNFMAGVTKTLSPLSAGLAGVRDIDPLQGLNDIAKAAASWNNVSKALFMQRFDRLVDRSGRALIYGPFDTGDIVAQAIGFQHADAARFYSLQDINHAKVQLRRDVVNSVVELMWDYSHKNATDTLTQEDIERTERMMAMYYQSLDTPYEMKLAREEVQRRLTEGTDRYSTEWRKYRRLFNDGSISNLLNMRQRLITRGLLREGGFETEEQE